MTRTPNQALEATAGMRFHLAGEPRTHGGCAAVSVVTVKLKDGPTRYFELVKEEPKLALSK